MRESNHLIHATFSYPLDSRSDNFTTSIVDGMTGRFVNSILDFVYLGRDSRAQLSQ